jgi:glycosyltransferase involved in cell wall biosynthesis
MKTLFVYPKGLKQPSGQTTAAEVFINSNKEYSPFFFPILERESGDTVLLYLYRYFKTLVAAIKVSRKYEKTIISIALSSSFLIRILPFFFVLKNIEAQIHSGPNIEIGGTQKMLLKLISKFTSVVSVLGPLKSVTNIFSQSDVKVVYFSNKIPVTETMKNLNYERIYDIGYISLNIYSKGFIEFVKLFRHLKGQSIGITAVAAGPYRKTSKCPDFFTKDFFDTLVEDFKSMGGVYIESTDPMSSLFYEEIKIFVFPSSFHGEALPMVVLEAMVRGCYVYSKDIGFLKYHFNNKNLDVTFFDNPKKSEVEKILIDWDGYSAKNVNFILKGYS